MKKYFYSNGINFGSFTLAQLRQKNITRETKVWFKELGEWKPAGAVLELTDIYKLTSPPITKKINL